MSANPFQHAPRGEPPPGVGTGAGGFDKSAVLIDYARQFKCVSLVETGLYGGRGSGMGLDWLRYFAIDYQPENARLGRLQRPEGVFIVGDSNVELGRLLEHGEVTAPCLFWLDAHAIFPDEPAPTICPVIGELEAILAWENASRSVVLIDDLWGFGSVAGWPSLPELRELTDRGAWNRVEQDGYMALTPRGFMPRPGALPPL